MNYGMVFTTKRDQRHSQKKKKKRERPNGMYMHAKTGFLHSHAVCKKRMFIH